MATMRSCWLAMALRPPAAPGGVDSLNVLPGETYDIAFVANNPGIWMDHCHNLKHAAQGMIAHLMYEGFDTPYRIAGPAENQPE
jgi:FtsP/CotA-like multicopper oxidase with cupredoxin domain